MLSSGCSSQILLDIFKVQKKIRERIIFTVQAGVMLHHWNLLLLVSAAPYSGGW